MRTQFTPETRIPVSQKQVELERAVELQPLHLFPGVQWGVRQSCGTDACPTCALNSFLRNGQ